MLTEHIFNIHDLVQLMTTGLCLLLALPMLLRRERRASDLPLALFLVVQGVVAANYVLLYSDVFGPMMIEAMQPLQFLPLTTAYLAQGTLLVWYSHALLQQPVRWHKGDLIAAGMLVGITVVTAAFRLTGVTSGLDQQIAGAFEPFPALLLSIVFGIRAIRLINRYHQEVRQRYSNIDDSNLLWLSYAVFGFVAIWIWRWLGAGVVSNYPAALLIAWMVVVGLGQRPKSLPAEDGDSAREGERDSGTTLAKHGEKLEDLMHRVRLYEDPELDLEGLADSMDLSPRSLSTVINVHFKRSFYDFVNHYRVEAAKAQLSAAENRGKSIQSIFEDVGFNSKSTFNSTFKKATGQTPSEYRRDAGAHGPNVTTDEPH